MPSPFVYEGPAVAILLMCLNVRDCLVCQSCMNILIYSQDAPPSHSQDAPPWSPVWTYVYKMPFSSYSLMSLVFKKRTSSWMAALQNKCANFRSSSRAIYPINPPTTKLFRPKFSAKGTVATIWILVFLTEIFCKIKVMPHYASVEARLTEAWAHGSCLTEARTA